MTSRRVLVLRTAQSRRWHNMVVGLAVCCVLIAIGVGCTWYFWISQGSSKRFSMTDVPVRQVEMPDAAPDLDTLLETGVMPIDPEEAKEINDKRPLDLKSLTPAKPFRMAAMAGDDAHYAAAVRCLAQAVYYEAAGESAAGQRAVAQVVLNRVRHPAFPNTVCGVVFQGSELTTGCQFSFTCDGSLLRAPSAVGFRRAEQLAREALGGVVSAEVGVSTHYHANYVVPYWASSLDKAKQLGTHIFYQMRGFLGSPRAFTMRYDPAAEFLPGVTTTETALLPEEPPIEFDPLANQSPFLVPQPNPLNEDLKSGALISRPASPLDQSSAPPLLRADRESGALSAETSRLKVDEHAEATPPDDGAAK